MLLGATTAVIILALFIQGSERVIADEITNDEGVLATSAVDSANDSYISDNSCCVNGYCSCLSLNNVLANLTSNVLVNITTDVMLSSIITLVDLVNITITGYNNPTVNCNNSGGLHVISCDNCTIEGIAWDGCGSGDENMSPVLQLFNSSSIAIRNCSFQHSIGQAIVLSEMIGDVIIDHCNFLSNKQYEGHGSAIHYSSNNILKSLATSIKFMIIGCNFLHNEGAESVVYLSQSSAKLCEYLKLQNSKFHNNIAIAIYLSNHNLYISKNIEFYNNTAEHGGGFFISDYSNVTFHKDAVVNFTHNRANNSGG